jgi:hypothetical protein
VTTGSKILRAVLTGRRRPFSSASSTGSVPAAHAERALANAVGALGIPLGAMVPGAEVALT